MNLLWIVGIVVVYLSWRFYFRKKWLKKRVLKTAYRLRKGF